MGPIDGQRKLKKYYWCLSLAWLFVHFSRNRCWNFVNRSLIASTIFYLESGKLIFDPSHKVRLTADDVLIMHNGSLIIGNPECEYKGDVEIVFTGGDEDPDVSFGHYTKVAQGKVTFEICNYCSFEWNKTLKFNFYT